jgi:transcriptional regulator with XRE-family HTH domain
VLQFQGFPLKQKHFIMQKTGQNLSVQKKSVSLQNKNGLLMETFGEYIRQLRINAGLPIRKIAAQLDIDSSLLGRIERNERQANKGVIAGIAKIFNQDEQDLFQHFLSDQIAYKIFDEDVDIGVLKVAEQKVEYLKSKEK